MVTPQSMSDLIHSLVELGLIDREPGAGRGYRKPAELTAAGRRRLQRCQSAVSTVQDSLRLDHQQTEKLNKPIHHVLNDMS